MTSPGCRTRKLSRSDYATNGGDIYCDVWSLGTFSWTLDWVESSDGVAVFNTFAGMATGIAYPGSQVTMAQVTDGASNTYLFGEKYINPDHYDDGSIWGDTFCAFGGHGRKTPAGRGRTTRRIYLDTTNPATIMRALSAVPIMAGAIWCSATVRFIRSATASA